MNKKFSNLKTFEDFKDIDGIPEDFIKKAKEGKPVPDMRELMKAGQKTFQVLNKIKNKESMYSNSELEELAVDTVRKLFKNKEIDFSNFNIDASIIPLPNPHTASQLKTGTSPGLSDEDYKEKRDELSDDEKAEVDKRRIINTLTQGFSMASQEDILMDDNVDLPSEIFSDYFDFMKVSHDTHWTIPDEMINDTESAHQMAIPLGRNKISYDKESGKYTIKAEASILILLIHEIIKGIYEIISFHGIAGKSKEELENIFKFTETYKHETEGLKMGPALVRAIREFYNELENQLIKEGKITQKRDILATLLGMLYTYPAESFLKITERLFDPEKKDQPFDEFKKLYLTAIDQDFQETEQEDDEEIEIPQTSVKLNMDDVLDKLSSVGFDNLTEEEKDFLKNQN